MKERVPDAKGVRRRTLKELIVISLIALLVFVIANVFNVFEIIAQFSRAHEAWNIDELVIVLAMLAFVFGIFSLRRWKELKAEIRERIKAEEKIKKINEDLKHRTNELELINKDLEAFSYSISHDLRNPLLAMGGFARILLERYGRSLDGKGQHYLKIILMNAERMCQLIDDLLTFSRSEHQQIELSDIDMEGLLKVLLEELKSTTSDRKLKLDLKGVPPAQGDSIMIRQVFLNLLLNSIKYTKPKDIGVIEIGGQDAGNYNTYYVKDNGVGFDMEQANKLFSVFQRLHSRKEFEGTGVGLAIVKRIVQRHGGQVWAEGKVNEGATFYFTLPRQAGDLR